MASIKRLTITSEWPLPTEGIRFVTPKFLLAQLSAHPISSDLYPLATGYYPNADGHSIKRLEHDSHLFVYCSAGKGSLAAYDKTWRVNAGDFFIIPKGIAHQYRANRNDPWTIYWVHYDGSRANDYLEFIDAASGAKGSPSPVGHIGPQPSLLADFENLFELRNAGYAPSAFVHAACLLQQMLTSVASMERLNHHQRGHQLDIHHIQQLMQKRVARDLDLDSLAEEARLSKYHFSRKFKQLTGHSPIQYFIHLKMQYACQLLDSSIDSIKQIAAKVGFDDPYYFSRQFKQVIGISPSQYRQERQA
jgi:AraC-like DNA-binding protein